MDIFKIRVPQNHIATTYDDQAKSGVWLSMGRASVFVPYHIIEQGGTYFVDHNIKIEQTRRTDICSTHIYRRK
jgi:hypothetical protein